MYLAIAVRCTLCCQRIHVLTYVTANPLSKSKINCMIFAVYFWYILGIKNAHCAAIGIIW